MKTKIIIFILGIMFVVGCMTTNTYHIDRLQIFTTKEGKQIFVLEKENIKAKTSEDFKKEIDTSFEQLSKALDAWGLEETE